MHPLVPDFILERCLAGEAAGSFAGVGLFLDISGFSGMADALMVHGQHGAEVLAGVMRAVLDPLIDLVFEQDGFIAASAGDALTALFAGQAGRPPAAARALAAASAMQQRMAAVNRYATPYGEFTISARIGLAAGEARWGILTQGEPAAARPARAIYYFQGEAVEGCAEIEHLAQAGQVLVDEAVRQAAGECIAVQPVQGGLAWVVTAFRGPWPAPVALRPPLTSPEALAAAAQFFPRAVLLQATPGEFRQAVSLFISLPAVRTETQLARFIESVFALQDRYGGLINHLDFGDKGTNLLLFWGAPAAFENDIERALNFILDLQTSTSIPISAGITYRISRAGFIGGKRHEEYTCFGRGVSLAARFMTGAPRGEIWLDEPVAQRAGGRFALEFVKEAPFKGFKVAQKVFVLLERKEHAEHFFEGRLAGREAVLDQLRRHFAPLLRGEPAGALVITGEAGMGKSRLAHTFLEGLQDSRPGALQVFLAQTDEILRLPLNPLVYWLRRYLNISEAQGEARAKRNFNRKLDELIAELSEREPGLAEELDRTRSFLGALVGLHWPDSLYEQLDAAGRYANTFGALVALLKAESRRAPLVVFVEDVHLLDADTTAFFQHLARSLEPEPGAAPYPLALLATSRPLAELALLAAFGCCELPLGGIARAGLDSLARDQLGGPPAQALLDMLEQRAEGNPFYAEQILRYLKDEGRLVWDGAAWAARPGAQDLPADVSVLLVARLDRLSQQVKDVVQMAAVLGREFEVTLLSEMLRGQRIDVLPVVAAAGQAEIWTAISEIRYIFKHALLREAAYAMQLVQRRQALHAAALQAFEALFAGRLEEAAGELAYHAEQAGLREPALRYLALAGEQAAGSYHNAQAITFYERALALAAEADSAGRAGLLLARESLFDRTGSLEARRADLLALEALLPALPPGELRVEANLRLAHGRMEQGEHEPAGVFCRQALAIAEQTASLPLQARAWLQLAKSYHMQGRLDEAQAHARQSLALARAAGRPEEEARSLNLLGLILYDLTRLDEARLAFEESRAIAARLGNLISFSATVNNLGMLCSAQARYAESLGYYEESLALARKTGDLMSQALSLGNLGFITGLLGNFGRAREALEQQLRILRVLDQPYYEAYALINLSSVTGALGEDAGAEAQARQALALARQGSDRSGEAWALTYLGHSCLGQGRLAEAAQAYGAAVALRTEMQQPVLAAEPAAGLARAALAQGDLPAAQQALAPVLAHLAAGGALDGADQPLRVYLACYLVLRQAGDPRAGELLAAGHAELLAQAARITDPNARRAFCENIAHHREILAAAAAE